MSDGLGVQNGKTEGRLTTEMLEISRNLVSDFPTGDLLGPGGNAVGDFLLCRRVYKGGFLFLV